MEWFLNFFGKREYKNSNIKVINTRCPHCLEEHEIKLEYHTIITVNPMISPNDIGPKQQKILSQLIRQNNPDYISGKDYGSRQDYGSTQKPVPNTSPTPIQKLNAKLEPGPEDLKYFSSLKEYEEKSKTDSNPNANIKSSQENTRTGQVSNITNLRSEQTTNTNTKSTHTNTNLINSNSYLNNYSNNNLNHNRTNNFDNHNPSSRSNPTPTPTTNPNSKPLEPEQFNEYKKLIEQKSWDKVKLLKSKLVPDTKVVDYSISYLELDYSIQLVKLGFPWDLNTFICGLKTGEQNKIKFVLENINPLRLQSNKTESFDTEPIYSEILGSDNVKLIHMLKNHGFRFPPDIMELAICAKAINVIQYLIKLGKPFNPNCFDNAIESADIDFMSKLLELGCPLGTITEKNLIYLRNNSKIREWMLSRGFQLQLNI